MSAKEITRRKFVEDVAKYCGAGIAALGLMEPGRAHGVADLDTPAHEGVWRMRDNQLMQYGEFIKNAPLPKDYFEKPAESLINGGVPVNWSHLHPNFYAEGNKSLVGLIMATELDKDLKGDIKKAVKLVGLGETIGDLVPFDPDEIDAAPARGNVSALGFVREFHGTGWRGLLDIAREFERAIRRSIVDKDQRAVRLIRSRARAKAERSAGRH